MRVFRVRGWFRQGLFRQKFERDFVALSEEQAMERVFSEVGSRHKLSRNMIHIEEVTEINPEEVTDTRVSAVLR